MKKYIFILSLILFVGCKTAPVKIPESKPVLEIGLITENVMVVSAREEASKIAADIMKQGGNAFDAMVATEMTLAVSYPFAGSLGGGGFMVYRKANGEIGSLDFREKAPMAASKDMYLDENGNAIARKSQVGALAVGVPGTVAGIFSVHEKLGSLPIQTILAPVIALAKKGYVVTQGQAESFNNHQEIFGQVNSDSILYSKNFKAGDTVRNLALAKTLQKLSDNGRNEYYGGETGDKLVKFIQKNGGIITIEDLRAYETVWRQPVSFNYKNLRIISMAPPSSGGVALAQIMKTLEKFPLKEYGHNSLKSIQLITEAERRAYADRSYYLGDPDFYDVPVAKLTSNEYLN
ncbi:MAG TPA: gamma-glutamyltransferase, partial [Gillisia sp.]|nr:gamma-glutamyltransferase [Gillisia sp.]